MPTPKVDSQRAAQIIALADQFGDKQAAKMSGVSTRTIERYRARALRDVGLAALVDSKRSELIAHTKHWADEADEFMSDALAAMRNKLAEADLRDVAGAYKIVGEMTLAREVLSIDDDESDDIRETEAHRAAERESSGEETEAIH